MSESSFLQKMNRSLKLWFILILLAPTLSGCFSIFRPLVSNSDGSKPANASRRAKVQADLAAGYVAIGRLDIAKDEVDKALRIDPNSPNANNIAGLIAMKIGKNNQAEEYLTRAYKVDPENSHYQNNLALFYCNNGSPSRGLELIRSALSNRLYNTPENSLMNGGICSEATGNLQEAERFYSQALNHDRVHLAAKEKLASVYLRTGRANKSWLLINQVIVSAQPATAKQLRLGAAAAQAIGRHDEASKLYQRLKVDYPKDIGAAGAGTYPSGSASGGYNNNQNRQLPSYPNAQPYPQANQLPQNYPPATNPYPNNNSVQTYPMQINPNSGIAPNNNAYPNQSGNYPYLGQPSYPTQSY